MKKGKGREGRERRQRRRERERWNGTSVQKSLSPPSFLSRSIFRGLHARSLALPSYADDTLPLYDSQRRVPGEREEQRGRERERARKRAARDDGNKTQEKDIKMYAGCLPACEVASSSTAVWSSIVGSCAFSVEVSEDDIPSYMRCMPALARLPLPLCLAKQGEEGRKAGRPEKSAPMPQ